MIFLQVDKILQNDNLDYVGVRDFVLFYESGCKCGKLLFCCDCCLYVKVFRFLINGIVFCQIKKI